MRYVYYQPTKNAFGMTLILWPEDYKTREYQAVYEGNIVGNVTDNSPEAQLDVIFLLHNEDEQPRNEKIQRSMSVGDIVKLEDDTVWLCKDLGWAMLAPTDFPKGVE